MNEHELSKLLHEAAGEAGVSSTAPRRVLRRARLRMATTGVVALSLVALLAGGAFAVATRSTEAEPEMLDSAQSPIVEAPAGPESDLVLSEDDGILLAEVQESDDRTWTFSGKAQRSDLCFNSTTHGPTTASGAGDCANLGVPQEGHLGFVELDKRDQGRYEVLGVVSTEVGRLDFEDKSGDRESVTLIDAPEALGAGRNFFYLWLPLDEGGALEARDVNGKVLQREQLCLSAGVTACSLGVVEGSASTSVSAGEPMADLARMACDEITPARVGRLPAEPTQERAIQGWIEDLDIDLAAGDFKSQRVGASRVLLTLREQGRGTSVSALLTKTDDGWSIDELFYCEGIVDPGRSNPPKGLPPPPNPPTTQPPPPPTPSP